MSRFGNEEDEMAAARARHAQRDAEEYEQDKRVSEQMWRDGERRRRAAGREAATSIRAPGHWRFTEMANTDGEIDGWKVEYDGRIQGILLLREGDLMALAAEDTMTGSPGPEDILAAFLHLYPRHPQVRLRAPGLPEGEQ